jgi:hypothetical protein
MICKNKSIDDVPPAVVQRCHPLETDFVGSTSRNSFSETIVVFRGSWRVCHPEGLPWQGKRRRAQYTGMIPRRLSRVGQFRIRLVVAALDGDRHWDHCVVAV